MEPSWGFQEGFLEEVMATALWEEWAPCRPRIDGDDLDAQHLDEPDAQMLQSVHMPSPECLRASSSRLVSLA